MSKLVEKIKNFFIELSDLINPSELDLDRIHYDKYGRLIFSDDRDLSGWGGFTKDVHCEKFKKGCYTYSSIKMAFHISHKHRRSR